MDDRVRGRFAGGGAAAKTVEPVRICFPFAGGAVGGSHISATKLIKAIDRDEFDPLVLLHRAEGPVVDLLNAMNIPFELAPTEHFLVPGASDRFRQIAAAATLTLELTQFLRRRRIQIVHTNDGPMHATWAVAARLAGAQLLWHHRGNPNAAGLRYLAPWLANRVVAVSNYAAPRPGRISAAAKCSVVHSPFDRRETVGGAAANTLRAQLGLSDTARILGFFGNLTDRKRPLTFVETIAAMVQIEPATNVVGLMFGDVLDPGLDLAVTARAAELGISDRIRLMGFRSPPEPWIELCELMVVTAVEEPFGRTLIEAMMLGTPVIAAASGGNLEAIRHLETGMLVAPDKPRAFADAALVLLGDPAWAAALAAAAREDALARYGIAQHVRSISEIYRQMAA